MGAVETEDRNQKVGQETVRSPDTLTRWFLATWRWLDESPFRQVWPFVLGILLAAAAVQITGRALWAVGIVVLVYIGIYRTAVKAMHYDQTIRKTLD